MGGGMNYSLSFFGLATFTNFLEFNSIFEHLTELVLLEGYPIYSFGLLYEASWEFSCDALLAKLIAARFSLQELKLSLDLFRSSNKCPYDIIFYTNFVVTTMKLIAATHTSRSCSVAVLSINFRSNVSNTK